MTRGASFFVFLGFLIPTVTVGALFAPGPLEQDKDIIVAHGERAAKIGKQLAQAHAVYAGPLFRIATRLIASNSLKAGEYTIPAHASILDIARMMHEGKSVMRLFTIPEGLTSSEIVQMLENDTALTGDIPATPPEGSLLPESYKYTYGDTRESLIERMQKGMQEKLDKLWSLRAPNLPLQTPRDAVTLASIVEKETSRPEERARIAGVFYNRLRLHMRLQSDPTVIYALSKGEGTLPRPLTHDDLAFPSPINTYASDGLPPQPICNPGIAALEATMHPEHNDYLYFVANGSGGHAFATNLAAQDNNINRLHHIENTETRK